MSRPDEGLIHQWLDGECTPEESARIEHLVATDGEWAAAVAEARGLIAASSRIIGALDAVPRAVPGGSTAAPKTSGGGTAPRRTLRLPAWIGVAAGVVLVAGTTYVLRENALDPVVVAPAQPLPTIGPVASAASSSAGSAGASAPASAPTPSSAGAQSSVPRPSAPLPSAPPPSAPTSPSVADVAVAEQRKELDAATARRAAEPSAEETRTRDAERQRVMRAVDAPRGASARNAEPAPAAMRTALPRLDGCWRVSEPPELSGVLEAPPIRRATGDTLVLVTPRGDVTVTRDGDELRGGLRATRAACETPQTRRVPR